MSKAIRIHQFGGPEQMVWEEVDPGRPGPGQALIRQHAIGVNFVDIYQRKGIYPVKLPAILGNEGAGLVEAVGKGVTAVKQGDRVAYAMGPGAYAETRLINADLLVKLPKFIDFNSAAAMMLKGMTAEYLLRRTYAVKPGDHILIHAAAGGVGLIACQWAKALGAIVIGTVSTEEKARLAKKNGCKYPIVTGNEDFVAAVDRITNHQGVAAVYDGIGQDTFLKSLECLGRLGTLALFGQASGSVAPFDPALLAKRGAFVTRPGLAIYNNSFEARQKSAKALFRLVKSGSIKIQINHTYALKDAAKAHENLAARKTTGSALLVP
jgi:NADPH2:quinone reductase